MSMLNDILIEPVLSEKATALREEGKYTFKVSPDANKTQIKEAVSKLFNVTVVNLVKQPTGKRQLFASLQVKQLRYSKAFKPS